MKGWPSEAVTRLNEYLRNLREGEMCQEDFILHNEIDPSDYYSI